MKLAQQFWTGIKTLVTLACVGISCLFLFAMLERTGPIEPLPLGAAGVFLLLAAAPWLKHTWLGVKFLVSLACIGMAGLIVFAMIAKTGRIESVPIGAIGVFLFLGALPWLDFKDARHVGWTMVLFALGAAAMAIYSIDGTMTFPENCMEYAARKARGGCQFSNLLYALGGRSAVAAVWVAFATLFGLGGLYALRLQRLK